MQGHLFYVAGGIREVDRWLGTPVYPERPFGTREFDRTLRGLRLEHVSYTYATGTQALKDVTSRSAPGRRWQSSAAPARVSRRSASLLLRLRAPTAGRITVDGIDYWEFSAESWHRAIALVEQDAFLFHGTLRENVVYGWQDVTGGASNAPSRRPI